MGHGQSKFRKRDVQAAVAGARAAGVEISSIKLAPDGSMVLATGKPGANEECGSNTWDEVLSDATQVETPAKIRR